MPIRYPAKRTAKYFRWHYRRAAAARRWGAGQLAAMPAVLGNAMPKSGSHLIIQVLEGLTEIGPFVNPGYPPVNRFEDNRKLPEHRILAEIKRMRAGDIRYGYLHAAEPWLSAVTGPGRAAIFVYRDPRDWVVSQVFYATDMHPGHMMHRYYTEELRSTEARIEAAIAGVDAPGVRAPGVVERYSHYLGWLQTPGVLCLRFEDLILDRETALAEILAYLAGFGFHPEVSQDEAVAALAAGIAPKKSGTFRKGQPGNWREHFTEDNKAHFKTAAGGLLETLGYEWGSGW
jgi:hypothetical protein